MSEHRTLQTDPGGDWENRLRAGLHDLETTPCRAARARTRSGAPTCAAAPR